MPLLDHEGHEHKVARASDRLDIRLKAFNEYAIRTLEIMKDNNLESIKFRINSKFSVSIYPDKEED